MEENVPLSTINTIHFCIIFSNVVFCLSVWFPTTEQPAVQTEGPLHSYWQLWQPKYCHVTANPFPTRSCIHWYIYLLRINFEAFKAVSISSGWTSLCYSAIAYRISIYLESHVNARGKKSALHFDRAKVISYGGHFVLCSEGFVNKWAAEDLGKLWS